MKSKQNEILIELKSLKRLLYAVLIVLSGKTGIDYPNSTSTMLICVALAISFITALKCAERRNKNARGARTT